MQVFTVNWHCIEFDTYSISSIHILFFLIITHFLF